MVKQHIKIYGRVKPTKAETESYKIDNDFKNEIATLNIHTPQESTQYVNNSAENHEFVYNTVFDKDCKQDKVFDYVARPVIDNVLQGYNGTVFAYGQTGSGKTWTMSGGQRSSQQGIIPRSLRYIFRYSRRHPLKEMDISISFFEIYNNIGYDLLDSKCHKGKEGIENLPRVTLFQENDTQQTSNASVHQVTNEEAAMKLFDLGSSTRAEAETTMNKVSSRSHCIFTIHVNATDDVTGGTTTLVSKLNLVDLAGSERIYKTGMSSGHMSDRQTNGSAPRPKSASAQRPKSASSPRLSNGTPATVPRPRSASTSRARNASSPSPVQRQRSASVSRARNAPSPVPRPLPRPLPRPRSAPRNSQTTTSIAQTRLREAKHINLSLHHLEHVIVALNEDNRSHIPYRNHMLTFVLRDSLGGNCMTSMIATCSVEPQNIEETISTCSFAGRVSLVTNEAVVNEVETKNTANRMQRRKQKGTGEGEGESEGETTKQNNTDQPIQNGNDMQWLKSCLKSRNSSRRRKSVRFLIEEEDNIIKQNRKQLCTDKKEEFDKFCQRHSLSEKLENLRTEYQRLNFIAAQLKNNIKIVYNMISRNNLTLNKIKTERINDDEFLKTEKQLFSDIRDDMIQVKELSKKKKQVELEVQRLNQCFEQCQTMMEQDFVDMYLDEDGNVLDDEIVENARVSRKTADDGNLRQRKTAEDTRLSYRELSPRRSAKEQKRKDHKMEAQSQHEEMRREVGTLTQSHVRDTIQKCPELREIKRLSEEEKQLERRQRLLMEDRARLEQQRRENLEREMAASCKEKDDEASLKKEYEKMGARPKEFEATFKPNESHKTKKDEASLRKEYAKMDARPKEFEATLKPSESPKKQTDDPTSLLKKEHEEMLQKHRAIRQERDARKREARSLEGHHNEQLTAAQLVAIGEPAALGWHQEDSDEMRLAQLSIGGARMRRREQRINEEVDALKECNVSLAPLQERKRQQKREVVSQLNERLSDKHAGVEREEETLKQEQDLKKRDKQDFKLKQERDQRKKKSDKRDSKRKHEQDVHAQLMKESKIRQELVHEEKRKEKENFEKRKRLREEDVIKEKEVALKQQKEQEMKEIQDRVDIKIKEETIRKWTQEQNEICKQDTKARLKQETKARLKQEKLAKLNQEKLAKSNQRKARLLEERLKQEQETKLKQEQQKQAHLKEEQEEKLRQEIAIRVQQEQEQDKKARLKQKQLAKSNHRKAQLLEKQVRLKREQESRSKKEQEKQASLKQEQEEKLQQEIDARIRHEQEQRLKTQNAEARQDNFSQHAAAEQQRQIPAPRRRRHRTNPLAEYTTEDGFDVMEAIEERSERSSSIVSALSTGISKFHD